MKIIDTLTGQKKEFKPLGDTVTMYVCGINPYSDSHIGHALSYIFFDTVRRYLEFRGYKVKHVENITDVEDNIINHANRLGITVKELSGRLGLGYSRVFAWFYKTGANVKEIKKAGPGKYAWIEK